jgi:NAD(P)-dependent dehydrogenase (short-subunit alcohol dehydrogenase family)
MTSIDSFRPGLFVDRSVALTGGGSGIGLATAIAFAQLGAKVSICGRRVDALEEAKARIEAAAKEAGHAPRVHARPADVKKPEDLAAWRDGALQAHGFVDVLICNAGANFLAPASQITPNGFATVVGTVLLGTWNTIHAWFPHLAERAQQGPAGASLLLMAATNGFTASPLMAHSGAGKAGMLNLAQTLAVEWAQVGIRVNAIAPGPVDTEGANSRLWADPEARKRVDETVPLGHMGTIDETIGPVLFLASPAARFMTGTVITVDGGNFLKPLPRLL